MRTTPFSSLVGGVGAIVMGSLFKFRALPFLHADTIISGGKAVPTAEFVASMSKMFYLSGAFAITLGIVLIFIRRGKSRSKK